MSFGVVEASESRNGIAPGHEASGAKRTGPEAGANRSLGRVCRHGRIRSVKPEHSTARRTKR